VPVTFSVAPPEEAQQLLWGDTLWPILGDASGFGGA
jgi:hypothetical protein